MSTPNVKTRQLSLPEVLRDRLTGISVPSSDSESGDPGVLHGTTKAGAKRPRKRRQLTGDTPNLPTNKKLNQQKTPPTMDAKTGKTNDTSGNPVELTPELKLLETRLQAKFDHSINKVIKPIQEQLNKLASTSDEVVQHQIEIKTLKQEKHCLEKGCD